MIRAAVEIVGCVAGLFVMAALMGAAMGLALPLLLLLIAKERLVDS